MEILVAPISESETTSVSMNRGSIIFLDNRGIFWDIEWQERIIKILKVSLLLGNTRSQDLSYNFITPSRFIAWHNNIKETVICDSREFGHLNKNALRYL